MLLIHQWKIIEMNTEEPIGGGLQGSIGMGLHSFNFKPCSVEVLLGMLVEGWDFIWSWSLAFFSSHTFLSPSLLLLHKYTTGML